MHIISNEPAGLLSYDDVKTYKPVFTDSDAKFIIKRLYNIDILSIEPLVSYADQNFKIKCFVNSKQETFILKILNTGESAHPERVEAQNRVLFHLKSKYINCPVPYIPVDSNSSAYFYVTDKCEFYDSNKQRLYDDDGPQNGTNWFIVRLMEYVHGITLTEAKCYTNESLFNVGQYAATLSLALTDCYEPIFKTYSSVWYMQELKSYPHITDYPTDDLVKKRMKEIFKEFTENVLNNEYLHHLQRGLTHSDLSDDNLVVEPNVQTKMSGVLDFELLNYSYYVFELGILIAYMLLDLLRIQNDRVDLAERSAHIIAGYMSKIPLNQHEFNVILISIKTRIMQSVANGSHVSAQQPENIYAGKNIKTGFDLITKLDIIGDVGIYTIWRELLAKTYNLTI